MSRVMDCVGVMSSNSRSIDINLAEANISVDLLMELEADSGPKLRRSVYDRHSAAICRCCV